MLDQLLVETTDSNKALYDIRLEYGHYHPDTTKYPAHRLLKQGPNAYGVYQYIWGTGFTSQDSYNVAKEFEQESLSFPTFIRSYRVLRSDYLVDGKCAGVVGTRGLPFTGVVAISVTAGGTGYTKDFAVTGSGGAGSGLAGTAIVNRGVVVRIEITDVGTGYTSAPTVVLSAGDGMGAAATAVIQPVAALLVSEKHGKLPEDDPYHTLYDRVTRVYMTLPGPTITATHYDPESDTFITVAKTKKLISAITEGVALGPPMTVTTKEPIDALTAYEVVTSYPDSVHKDLAHALEEDDWRPYQFPARFDKAAFATYAVPISYRKPFNPLTKHTFKTYFVISATKPDITSLIDGIAFGDTIYANNGYNFENALHDAITVVYTTGGSVTFPATVPSWTTFTGSWIGTQRAIAGSVMQAGSPLRWKVKITYVEMQ